MRRARSSPRPAALLALTLLASLASLAYAAPAAAQDGAAAAALFDRGLAEMKAGRYDNACPALSSSYKLDPRPGALFTLAECEAKRDHAASAIVAYNDYLALFGRMKPAEQSQQGERPAIAARRKIELKPDVAELTIQLAPDMPASVLVRRDGTVLEGAALGIPLPMDPGEHELTVQLPGGAPTSSRIPLARGEKRRIVLTSSTSAQPLQAPPPPPPPPPPPAPELPPPPPREKYSTPLFVVGVVAIPVGALAGVISLGAVYICAGPDFSAFDSCTGQSGAAIGSGLLILGGIAAVAVGSRLVPVNSPPRASPTPAVAIGPGSATLRWTF